MRYYSFMKMDKEIQNKRYAIEQVVWISLS